MRNTVPEISRMMCRRKRQMRRVSSLATSVETGLINGRKRAGNSRDALCYRGMGHRWWWGTGKKQTLTHFCRASPVCRFLTHRLCYIT